MCWNSKRSMNSVCCNGNLKFPISLCSRGCGNSRLCFLSALPWNEDNSLWLGASREFSPSLPTISWSLPKSSQRFLCGRRFLQTIPKADLYVLSHVLHDWSEDKVDLILSNVYKCLPSGNFNRKKVLPFSKGSSTHVRKYVRKIKSKQKILGSAGNLQFGSRKRGLLCLWFNYRLRGHQGLQFKQERRKWSMGVKSYTRASKIVAFVTTKHLTHPC